MAQKIRSGSASTRDGITLHYVVHGDDATALRRLVLIHSLGMSGAIWGDVAERLAGEATVLTYDCRGHGASTKAPGPYSIEMFARDLGDLLDDLGWDAVHVAGGSMGGNVALQTAILFRSRVRSLGLIDTTSWYGADAAQRWEPRAQEAETKGLGGLMEFQEARWFSDAFRAQKAEPIKRCADILLANDPNCYAASCRMLGSFDLRSGLPGIRVPTSVVVGEEDYATPVAMAQDLQSGIPGATLQVIPGLRHLTFVERPDIVADALSDLLTRVAA